MSSEIGLRPTVVRLKRKNGKIVQDCDIYIGRRIYMGGWRLDQSKWANPYIIRKYETALRREDTTIYNNLPAKDRKRIRDDFDVQERKRVLTEYEKYIRNSALLVDLDELSGSRLGCWCVTDDTENKKEICHGQILVRLWDEYVGSKV